MQSANIYEKRTWSFYPAILLPGNLFFLEAKAPLYKGVCSGIFTAASSIVVTKTRLSICKVVLD